MIIFSVIDYMHTICGLLVNRALSRCYMGTDQNPDCPSFVLCILQGVALGKIYISRDLPVL